MAITAGSYKARATGEVVLGNSANKGTPFIELYFQISDGGNKGDRVRWTSYFSDKSAERTIEALQHCGWEGEELSDFADGHLNGLDKNEVEIVVELEEYEKDGETRSMPRVKWVNRLGGHLNIDNAMSVEAAQTFSDKMRGLVLKMKSKKPPQGDAADFPYGANAPEQKQASGQQASGQRKAW